MTRRLKRIICFTSLTKLVLGGGLLLYLSMLSINVFATPLACEDFTPQRRAYFGDLHVHSAWSLDAYTQGTRNSPLDIYRFAQGDTLGIQPYDSQGNPYKTIKLARPLDFAAVTDHAELLGEVKICSTPGMTGYFSPVCNLFRHWPKAAFIYMNSMLPRGQRHNFCGDNSQRCLQATLIPWEEIRGAAQVANKPCNFTTFIGYEWTGFKNNGNLHRNVIFRNQQVPKYPVSFYQANTAKLLRQWLAAHCLDAGNGCDVVVIPHNSNLSRGYMFPSLSQSATAHSTENDPIKQADLQLQHKLEPLVEIIQHKGSSECYYGSYGLIQKDELCAFEYLPYNTLMSAINYRYVAALASHKNYLSQELSSYLAKLYPYTPKPTDGYLREVLREGLKQRHLFGVNGYQFGFIGSTDTHFGSAGKVAENSFDGHGGAGVTPEILGRADITKEIQRNPGGLAVIWAEQNTRDALFDGMQRKETYATSGPRIRLRFFGGWDYPPSLCKQADFTQVGYQQGVPMGGTLPAPPSSPKDEVVPQLQQTVPHFAVAAWMDSGTSDNPSVPLERIQIIKGWVDKNGTPREKVFAVSGEISTEDADLNTCTASNNGSPSLCSVWKDPQFDPTIDAYYYARVLQVPTCRWQQYICNKHQVDCNNPKSIKEGLHVCCANTTPKTIRERALSSPIWFHPQSSVVPASTQ